ncbi:putative CxxC motif protein [Halorubrum virus Serpecor1]|uniref:Putative CxxC motif protein n=1 Tax=Halorubrum virus Serpecor1 TaxID=2721757 RepID=A0A6G9RW65_9CAUD|nr:putative CxxC motif protein [Halorubrum virus Serpecor1]QIR31227.1 putative CxxC motif protein [Halorubrum virus Serpecor1]
MSHCDCSPEEQDYYKEEISPSHHDGETWATKCRNCWGLVRIH